MALSFKHKLAQLGGPFLVRLALAARAWNPIRLQRERTVEMEQQFRTAEALTQVLLAPIDDLLAADPALLSPQDKTALRARFYRVANMPASRISSWMKDPRLVDGTGKKRGDAFRVRAKLRQIVQLRTHALHSGEGWSNRDYRLAQDVIFVGEALFHPQKISYQVWAALRNFGIDWERPSKIRYSFGKLPAKVKLEADLALLKYTVVPPNSVVQDPTTGNS